MIDDLEPDADDSSDDVEHLLRQVEGEIAWIKQMLTDGDADGLRSHFDEIKGWIDGLETAIEDHAAEIES